MTERELRSLGKVDLLRLLRDQELRIEELAQRNESLEKQLEEKNLSLNNAGSIAEAALQVNNIFKVAQESADIYIANIHQMEERSRAEAEAAEERAQKKADEIVREAERRCAEIEARGKRHVEELWVEFQDKMMQLCKSYSELGELVAKINILQSADRANASVTEI